MGKINAIITGIGGYVPDYVLTNEELSRMVDTNDEWIMTRVGIKERRILTEEGLGTSYMARKAAKQLIKKTGYNSTGGTVTPNILSAPAGMTITLTATPAEDYVLKEGSITENGVAVSGNTFTMPAANVVIMAEFEHV